MYLHTTVDLTDQHSEFIRATKLAHHLPESLTTYGVKSFGEVNKDCAEVSVVLKALFLQLTCCKEHVCSPSSSSQAALALWQKTKLQMGVEAIE